MKRLIDLPDSDALTARARSLVRALGPTPESEARALHVRRRLDAPASVVAPRWTWRAALAVGLLGAGAAAASATVSWSTPKPTPRAITTNPAPRQPAKPAAPAALPAPTPQPGLEPVATPTARPPTPHVTAAVVSDVARVHAAAKALRHDGDPERALQLLERPGTRITGPLAEEALALRIEASTMRRDGRNAKLATAYLQQYPHGRYRELARKALAGQTQ